MTKICYILRGCPGSGKSTIAGKLPVETVVSADDFFVTENGYQFDAARLAEAHGQCWSAFEFAIDLGASVAVDNTNTTRREYERYLKKAKENGYLVCFVDIPVPFIEVDGKKFPSEKYIEECTARNVHGCPKHVVEKMCENLLRTRGF